MINLVRSLLATIFALVALSAAAGNAVAASISFSPAGEITAGSLETIAFTANSMPIECHVTLRGTLQSGNIAKVAGTRIGLITGVRWTPCIGGEMGRVLALPWNINYSAITGALPERITSILVSVTNIGVFYSLLFGIANCLYRGSFGLQLPTTLIRGTQYRTGLPSFLAREFLRKNSSPAECPPEGSFSGTFSLTTQTVTRS